MREKYTDAHYTLVKKARKKYPLKPDKVHFQILGLRI